jgi:hypothetical protein
MINVERRSVVSWVLQSKTLLINKTLLVKMTLTLTVAAIRGQYLLGNGHRYCLPPSVRCVQCARPLQILAR